DAQSGAVIFAQDANGSFQPASTMKLIVGGAVLTQLGADYSFLTDALTDGSVSEGVLHGRLYLRGGGDPTLDEAAMQDAANALRAQSISRVDGELVVDAAHFDASEYPPGWVIDDLPQDYAAPVSGLSYDDNAVTLALTPGASVASPVNLAMHPQTSSVTVTNDAITGAAKSRDTTVLERPLGDPRAIRVTGSLPLDTPSEELVASAGVPELFAADALQSSLASVGIRTSAVREGGTPPRARVLWHHRSVPVRDLLAKMWLPSDNLLAESLLEELGTASEGTGDTRERGIDRETAWLRTLGIDPATLSISDGSGLSQYDRITPASLVTLLRALWLSSNRASVLAALPVAGQSGTLRDAFVGSSLAGHVVAKTGSMSHVRTLAGYLVTPARTLVFALFVNDWMDSSAEAGAEVRDMQQRFLEAAASTHP
ncbi:MAG: D-alanyl-D-alanine carboxypeptidase/D-alanyl-D-alanine-endopeptidase, partial [Candidatus Baltobacteraceae bacterium]